MEMMVDDVVEFVSRALVGRRRVLEVGCGRGEVAAELAGRGFEVTALDVALRDVVAAPAVRYVECDFLRFDDEPFDAVVFTSSLHHVQPLDEAIGRARQLVREGGLLVADEFDHEAPDAATLRWYYDVQELLVAAGAYPAERVDRGDDVVARWTHAHHHEPRLHGGDAMLAAIGERFRLRETTHGPYLYRYIAHGTGEAAGGVVRAIETRLLAVGLARPVGLRIIADAVA